mmetsp:Transcript_140845/g.351131  ORF Transcript_140845/g.351131 Transcript_140845/m.351131 type:complete len:278 (-) Transcript_140845:1748-2581(-)
MSTSTPRWSRGCTTSSSDSQRSSMSALALAATWGSARSPRSALSAPPRATHRRPLRPPASPPAAPPPLPPASRPRGRRQWRSAVPQPALAGDPLTVPRRCGSWCARQASRTARLCWSSEQRGGPSPASRASVYSTLPPSRRHFPRHPSRSGAASSTHWTCPPVAQLPWQSGFKAWVFAWSAPPRPGVPSPSVSSPREPSWRRPQPKSCGGSQVPQDRSSRSSRARCTPRRTGLAPTAAAAASTAAARASTRRGARCRASASHWSPSAPSPGAPRRRP